MCIPWEYFNVLFMLSSDLGVTSPCCNVMFISAQGSCCSCNPWGTVLQSRHDTSEQHAAWAAKLTQFTLLFLYFLSLSSASCRDSVLQNLLCGVPELILLSRALGTVWLCHGHNSGLKKTWHFKLHSIESTLYWQNSVFWLLRILFASLGLCFL